MHPKEDFRTLVGYGRLHDFRVGARPQLQTIESELPGSGSSSTRDWISVFPLLDKLGSSGVPDIRSDDTGLTIPCLIRVP